MNDSVKTVSPASEPSGHAPTLFACFAHFDVCFMLWVLVGALGTFIFDGSSVEAGLKGLMVGLPVLTGSLLRVPLGILSDRFGARRIAIGLLLFLVVPLTLGWLATPTISMLVVTALTLGTAGASFAVVLPLASRWYPRERQGLVMGIAAAGNSGTVIANLIAPRLATAIGWHNVFGLALIPLGVVLVLFAVLAQEPPKAGPARSPREYFSALSNTDTWWFCVIYCITFGSYVGLSSFLPIFLRDQFNMAPVAAGSLTAAAALAGSVSRPAGGYIADRVGGAGLLHGLLTAIAIAYVGFAAVGTLSLAVPLLLVTMICLGLGNGVVFQLIPQRFAREIGSVTGLVGAVGGVGGFILPTVLGSMRQTTGSYSGGFVILAIGAACGLWALRTIQSANSRDEWNLAPLVPNEKSAA